MAAKVLRKFMKIFGNNAGSNQRGVFGSLAAGAPAYATDPEAIQGLPNYEGGWYDAVVGNNSPAMQDMNALCFLFAYQLAYGFQAGVPEWDDATEYFIGSIVSVSGKLWVSKTDNNLNNAVTWGANWKPYSTDQVGTGKDWWLSTAPDGWIFADGQTIGSAASGATNRANADTLDLYTALWNDYSNTLLPIQDSAGVATTRGANAAADFAANKRLPVIDKRGRVSAGRDNMGGSAASRLTNTSVSPDGNTIGAAGGAQTHTLTTAQLAVHTHTQNAHSHGITDNGHQHTILRSNIGDQIYGDWTISSGASRGAAAVSGTVTNPIFATNAATGIIINNATPTNNNEGSGAAHNNTQPTIVCNYILKL